MQFVLVSVVLHQAAFGVNAVGVESFVGKFLEDWFLNVLIATVNKFEALHDTLDRLVDVFVATCVVQNFEAFFLVVPFLLMLMSDYEKIAIDGIMHAHIIHVELIDNRELDLFLCNL